MKGVGGPLGNVVVIVVEIRQNAHDGIGNEARNTVDLADVLEQKDIEKGARCAHDERSGIKTGNTLATVGNYPVGEVAADVLGWNETLDSWVKRSHFKRVKLKHGGIEGHNLSPCRTAICDQDRERRFALSEIIGEGNARERIRGPAVWSIDELIAQRTTPAVENDVSIKRARMRLRDTTYKSVRLVL